MKKIFECSNGIEFFSNGESIVGTLSKEEAIEFVTEVAKSAVKIEDHQGFKASLKLLAAIRTSYIQISAVEIEVIVII
jgi:hypothetical protein